MPNNFEYEDYALIRPGAIPDGTIIRTTQNADLSHTQHVNVDSIPTGSVVITSMPTGSVSIIGNGIVSILNSSTTPLGGGASFSGTYENVLDYSSITISTHSNVASATNGLKIYFSKDGITGFESDAYTIAANTCKTYAVQTVAPFFKITYTNGVSAQASFTLCVVYKKIAGVASSHRIGDTITNEDDAQLVKAVLSAQKPNGDQTNIDATAGGNLKVSIEEVEAGVAFEISSLPTGSVNVLNFPTYTTVSGTVTVSRGDTAENDAFGRQRVSNTGQRADVEFTYDAQPLLMEQVTAGSGTITYNTATRDVTLLAGNTVTGSYALFPLHYYVPYTPGNGQLVEITGNLDYAGIGTGTASIFLKNNGVETVYPQASWNMNTVPTANWARTHIFAVDFQSLKVGRLRFALVRNGLPVFVHQIVNDNIRANGYWQHPNQPLVWRIYNDGTNTVSEMGYFGNNNGFGFRYTMPSSATATMLAVCATVKSEGGQDLFDMAGFPFSASNGASTKTVSNSLIPMLSIQLKTTFNSLPNRGIVIPTDLSFVTDNSMFYQVVLNPVLTNASFGSVGTNSLCNFDVAATALSGGTVLSSGYVGSGGARAGGAKYGLTGRVPLTMNYTGTTGDILTIAAIRVGTNNATAGAAIDWKEVR